MSQLFNLQDVKTKSGKTIKDFRIPDKLLNEKKELVMLILRSEAMDDEEKQYWFTLSEVMSEAQLGKLYSILKRERDKLDEIAQKYGSSQPINPEEAHKKAYEKAQYRLDKQEALRQKEAQFEAGEDHDAVLAEVDNWT